MRRLILTQNEEVAGWYIAQRASTMYTPHATRPHPLLLELRKLVKNLSVQPLNSCSIVALQAVHRCSVRDEEGSRTPSSDTNEPITHFESTGRGALLLLLSSPPSFFRPTPRPTPSAIASTTTVTRAMDSATIVVLALEPAFLPATFVRSTGMKRLT